MASETMTLEEHLELMDRKSRIAALEGAVGNLARSIGEQQAQLAELRRKLDRERDGEWRDMEFMDPAGNVVKLAAGNAQEHAVLVQRKLAQGFKPVLPKPVASAQVGALREPTKLAPKKPEPKSE